MMRFAVMGSGSFLRFCKKSPLTRGAEWDILNKLLSGREGFLPPTQKYLKKELDKLP